MATFIQTFKENYNDWKIGQNPEVDTWFLMENPGNIVLIVSAYLLFVLKIGPFLMRNREPLELRKALIVYNGLQVLFSVMLVWMSLRVDLPFKTLFSSACHHRSMQPPRNKVFLVNGAWWYFFAKLTELLDTVFFVLRKRYRQISFLHVYHHSATMAFSWAFLKYAPGEQGAIIGLLNSLVHVFMYTYYMISAMGPKYQKYLWWKKYMTVIQLIQFCMMIAYMSLLALSNCGYPRSVSYFFIANALIFLYLFSGFYRDAYKKKPAAKANGIHSASNGTSVKIDHKENAYSQITKDVEMLDRCDSMKKIN